MKKTKLFAVLSAAMLGCCAMGGTAFAEEAEPVDYSKYQLGDINLDGEVDVDDAQFALQCYSDSLAHQRFKSAPYEQQLLACSKGFIIISHREYPDTGETEDVPRVLDVDDVNPIMKYYVNHLAKKTDQTYEAWLDSNAIFQQSFTNYYNRYKHEPSTELFPHTEKVDGEEKVIYYYSRAYAVKVR